MIVYPVGFVVLVVTKMFTNIITKKNNKEDTNTASLVVSVVSQTLNMYDSQIGNRRDNKEGSIAVSLVVFVVMEITVLITT